ncbi:putative uncharacterized protein [Waddlia chondrophila 2032/99]|uniref:Uncharacterized protein n=1 Tax=Waddlia chondrophila 2032/99 TaxID=765953 RepID=F8LEZ9_9BACT|nr:putative uncharacterized protein [Waddlia chondrophila 2032/99]
MTFLLPVKIDGAEYQAHAEYTSNAVGKYYKERLKPFADVFNLGLNDTSPDTDAIRALIENGTYHTEMETALQELLDLAQNGITDPNDPVDPNRKHYLSVEMSASLNQLIKTLKAAGADIDVSTGTVNITANNVVEWKSLSVNSDAIRQVIAFTLDTAGDQNRTLQALVELIYVKTGNEILTQNLNDLETALSTTKDSLKTLTQLQDLHNKIETTKQEQSFVSFASQNYSDGNNSRPTAFVEGSGFDGIAGQASKFFQELQPTVDVNNLTNADTALFLELRNDLVQQISILTQTTPGAGTSGEAGSLLDKLKTVKSHIDMAIEKAGGVGDTDQIKRALRYWILDSQTDNAEIDGIEPGQIQREITAALSAGQSLNDSQKEEVRRYLFVFEEYYKSAAAILNKITQLLERMAQGIAR